MTALVANSTPDTPVETHFQGLSTSTVNTLENVGFISPYDSEVITRAGKGGAELQYHGEYLHKVGDVRSTYITSPRAEIFNLMVFPENLEHLPVFAAEIVLFNGKVRVGVIDLQPVCNTIWRRHVISRRVMAHHSRFNTLPSGGPLPEWAVSHFSPGAIHTSDTNGETIPRLLRAYYDYLHLFRKMAQTYPPLPNRYSEQMLREYKAHHIKHSPGTVYLSRIFGEDWTRDFMRLKMYA
ncbi:MAG: hypothetical protein JJU11_11085 [Candidatus Sumerlaeia bacterium]|nr:hypothetical protein [Candidatus Sumerlaeia bacterium]